METPTALHSPSSHSCCSSSSSSTHNLNLTNNGGFRHHPPPLPSPIPRSESNPYPTTFVQADTNSFKQVVQMLTGSSDTGVKSKPTTNHIPPIKTPNKSKLYERRNSLKGLQINPLFPRFGSPREILSPSILDFPALALSPVTPLIPDPFNRVDKAAEDKAIAEKGFFLHPSPVSTPRDSEPRLLPLFPVTSPRVSSGSHLPSP